MPIAFKEWAVTVRALAEGEQLITLRKGVLPRSGKPFKLGTLREVALGLERVGQVDDGVQRIH